MFGGAREDEYSISLLSRIVAVAKLTTLLAQRAYRHYSASYVVEQDRGADQKMPMGSDLLSSAERVDKILQSFLQLHKCKFCGAVISQKEAFCEKCGKSQV
jgi:hypothetical protein